MFSNTFNNLLTKHSGSFCKDLSCGDAYVVIHEITKMRNLNNSDKYHYITDFIRDNTTVQTVADKLTEQLDEANMI